MLASFRKGWLYSLFLAFLLLGGASLVMMDYGGYFQSTHVGGDLARIGRSRITAQEFDRTLRRMLAPQQMNAEQAYALGFTGQVLRMMVLQRLFEYEARALGVIVSDDQVVSQMRKQLGPMAKQGVSSAEALRAFLRQRGLSEPEFIEQVRSEVATGLLRNALANAVVPPSDGQVQDLARAFHESMNVDVLPLPFSAVEVRIPNEKTLRAFYDARKNDFLLPERRDIRLATIPLSKIQTSATLSEDDLRKAYEEQKENFLEPETRILEQAVLKSESDAQKVIAALKTGAAMVDALKASGARAESYRGTQSFTKEGLPEDLATPVFEAQKKDIVGPLTTALGAHVFVVKDILPTHTKPFEEVKEKIEKELKETRFQEAATTLLDDLQDQASRGESLPIIAKNFKMDLKEFKSVEAESKTDLKPEFLRDAFAQNEGEVFVGSAEDGTIYALEVSAITPAQPKDFSTLKDILEKQWTAAEQRRQTLQNVQQALADLEDKKTTLSALAEKYHSKITPLQGLEQTKDPESLLAKEDLERLFGLNVGDSWFFPKPNQALLVLVKARTLPKNPDAAPVRAAVASGQQESAVLLYMNALRARVGANINEGLLQALYAKKEAEAP